jgi:hypothetical protein
MTMIQGFKRTMTKLKKRLKYDGHSYFLTTTTIDYTNK